MGELGVLFNPGMRHEREEKLAKQMLREDEGTGRKGRLGIDLESGVVVIGAGETTARQPDAPTTAGPAAPSEEGSPASSPTESTPERSAARTSTSAANATPPRTPKRSRTSPSAGGSRTSTGAVPSGKANRRDRRSR